jgi:CRISPR-associated protein Cas1
MKRLRTLWFPLDAMMNYAYAVLEAEIRIRRIYESFDQRNGILHVAASLPVVDSGIVNFVRSQTFSAKDFVLRNDGVCRLSPQVAMAVAHCAQKSLATGGRRIN